MGITTEILDLELSLIIRDPELQPREQMDHDRVAHYTEVMLAALKYRFPAVVVYYDGERYWLSQGFHRCTAAEHADFETIPAEVRQGTRTQAKEDAACSNMEFDELGMPRKPVDRRRSVKMYLEVHPDASDRAVAKRVGVHDRVVASVRQDCAIRAEETRIGLDGIKRPATNGRKVEPKPEPELEPEVVVGIKPAAKSKFNETNDMVDWARWTWNPVTGCEHNCVYCYARDIANRFYPEKFVPTFHQDRLEAPRNTFKPDKMKNCDSIDRTAWRNVFVCSMADLFGRWVPDEWIDQVFDSCRQSPEWNYLFLTKFPQRYVGLDFPDTAWVGTSVDEQKRVANAEKAFSRIEVPIKWLSVEPMRERIEFSDLSMFHWVVIGGQSRSTGAPEFHPEFWWVADLAYKARESGCKVYIKPNTFSGAPLKEYPY